MTRRFWTEVEEQMLRLHYADSHTEDLAKELGRPVDRVRAKANAMGLRKTREFIAEVARARSMTPGHPSQAHRFQKGIVPHNKGIKRPDGWAPGRMRETQFRPGNKPVNWAPVGSYRVNTDGVFERKFSDEPGPPKARWRAVARLVWEEQIGPVPPGHIVVFKRGMRPERVDDIEAYTVERLECISRAENMQRNTYHQYGPEVSQLVQLRGVLTRTINQRKKKEGRNAQQDDE